MKYLRVFLLVVTTLVLLAQAPINAGPIPGFSIDGLQVGQKLQTQLSVAEMELKYLNLAPKSKQAFSIKKARSKEGVRAVVITLPGHGDEIAAVLIDASCSSSLVWNGSVKCGTHGSQLLLPDGVVGPGNKSLSKVLLQDPKNKSQGLVVTLVKGHIVQACLYHKLYLLPLD